MKQLLSGQTRFARLSIAPLAVLLLALLCTSAWAGFTETLPKGAFMLDEGFVHSWLDKTWDNDGNAMPLIEDIKRYEPGGGKQGVLIPKPNAKFYILINKLQYGILDDLSVGLGVPVVLGTTIDPNLQWESGDYQRQIGRTYSEDDFWRWAGSMGQSKPGAWSGNHGVLSDIILGARFRWSHRIPEFKAAGWHSALSITGAIPTGTHGDPEEIVAAGTTMWDLHTQGDLAFHLSFDKDFKEELDGRLGLGLDLFYETFFDRTYTTPTGVKNPLLLTYAPYVGETYKVNPGDFCGFSFKIDIVPYFGPEWETWMNDYDASRAKNYPPIIAVYILYSFVGLQQTDWKSENAVWDWDREKLWRPGYKNAMEFNLTISFLRLGAPLQVYCNYRTLSLIPGKNARAADAIMAGIRAIFKFW